MNEFSALADGLRATVPFVRTLGIEVLDLTATRAVVRLPDNPAHHNHIAGPHAGAMFTLAETASGAIVLAAFGEQLSRATPLTTRAEITYTKTARGPVTATATFDRSPAEVIAELDAGQRPTFPVAVEITTENGTTVATMTVEWTLRPNTR